LILEFGETLLGPVAHPGRIPNKPAAVDIARKFLLFMEYFIMTPFPFIAGYVSKKI